MPNDPTLLSILFPIGLLSLFVAYGYAAFWAFTIRRRLLVADFRAQALGVAAVALYFFVIGLANSTLPIDAQSSGNPVLVNALVDTGYLGILMYWIHGTVTVSKRSDPFERDTLRYSSTKYVWVAAVAILVVLSLIYNPIGLVITAAVPLPPLYLASALAPWVVGASFGAVMLYLSASRSKDRTLRLHIRWLATYALVSLFNIVFGAVWRQSGGNNGPYAAVFVLGFVGGQGFAAYCLYRSVKSLASITKTL